MLRDRHLGLSRHVLRAWIFVSCLLGGALVAQAEPNFVGSQTMGSGTYRATAHIGVQIPTGYTFGPGTMTPNYDAVDPNNPNASVDHYFDVIGDVTIFRGGPSDNSYIDPLSNETIGVSGDGLNSMRVEIVSLNNYQITSSTASAEDLVLGDRIGNDADDGAQPGEPRSFYSTGGISESAPDGSTAEGYLNLFMEVNVTSDFPNNLPNQGPMPVGHLHNEIPLHLENLAETLTEFPPDGVVFSMLQGAMFQVVPLFSRPGAPITQFNSGNQVEMARFVVAELTIVPELDSLLIGALGMLGFLVFAWNHRRRVPQPVRVPVKK